jgi:hypothetical protein
MKSTSKLSVFDIGGCGPAQPSVDPSNEGHATRQAVAFIRTRTAERNNEDGYRTDCRTARVPLALPVFLALPLVGALPHPYGIPSILTL